MRLYVYENKSCVALKVSVWLNWTKLSVCMFQCWSEALVVELHWWYVITSCCSSVSKRPHHCCHLANTFDSLGMFPILLCGPGHAPEIAHSSAGSSPHLIHGSLGPPTLVHTPNGISIGLVVFVWLTVVSNRQTDYRKLVKNSVHCHTPIQPNIRQLYFVIRTTFCPTVV